MENRGIASFVGKRRANILFWWIIRPLLMTLNNDKFKYYV